MFVCASSDLTDKVIVQVCAQRAQELDEAREGIYLLCHGTPACRHVYFSSCCCHCFAAGLELTFWNSFVAQIPASITTFPSSAQIVPEPLGVVLIISAWNYPFSKLMSLSCKSFFQIEIDGSPASSLKKTLDKVVIKQFVVA